MTIVERDLEDGSALYDTAAADPDEPVAVREIRPRFTTLLWSSRYDVAEALGAFKSFIDSSDQTSDTELVFSSGGGYSQRSVGDDVEPWIRKLQKGPEAVSKVRVECVIPSIGPVALAFNRSVPGMNLAGGAVSVTAPKINHACIRALFENFGGTGNCEQFRLDSSLIHRPFLAKAN